MRRIILITGLLLLSAGVFAQSRWSGFLEPKTGTEVGLRGNTNEWFFRPSAQLTAIQFTYNKETKMFESAAFSSAGIGLGYQHYIVTDGTLVNNYGFNALVIFDASQSSQGGVGLAVTANALQFVNIGAGYNLTDKQFFILTGCVWNF